MIHVRSKTPHEPQKNCKNCAVCEAELMPGEGSVLVDAAFASDCDDCRTKLGVARVNDKSWDEKRYGITPEPVFEPQPMVDAEGIIESARKNRA